jgi:hypothetical protein
MGLPVATKRITSDILSFLNDHVLSVTQLIRTKKLAEILDSYSRNKSTDVYVIQNTKKPGKAVIVELNHFQELLLYKEAVEQAIDQAAEEMALERLNATTDVPVAQVMQDYNLDIHRIMELVDEVEEEDG